MQALRNMSGGKCGLWLTRRERIEWVGLIAAWFKRFVLELPATNVEEQI